MCVGYGYAHGALVLAVLPCEGVVKRDLWLCTRRWNLAIAVVCAVRGNHGYVAAAHELRLLVTSGKECHSSLVRLEHLCVLGHVVGPYQSTTCEMCPLV